MTPSPRLALMWSLAERYANFALGLAATLVLARLLTPAQVGVYSVCAAFGAMAAILRDFGVSEYLIQERDLTRAKVRAAMGIALIMAWTLGAALYLAREPLAVHFAEPGVAQVLAITTLHFLILPLSSPAFALMNRELAFRQIFFLQTACNVAHSGTSVLLAWQGYGPLALAWAPVVSVTLQTAILAWLRPRDTFVMPSLREARPVLSFGAAYMASRTIETVAQNVHEPVIAKAFGFPALGLFSRASGMVDLFRNNVADAITRVATPAFAAEHRAGRPVAQALLRTTTLFTALSWPFFGFVALAAAEIIGLLLGAQWLAAAPLAAVLALAALPAGLHEFVPQLLSATGHVRRRLQVSVLVSAVHVTGVLVAAQFGLMAVAAVAVISSTVMLALCSWHLKQALGLPLSALLRACQTSAAVALVSVAVQAAVLAACRGAGLPAVAVLAATLLAGTLAWAAAARTLNHPAWHEVMQLLTLWRQRRAQRTKPGNSPAP